MENRPKNNEIAFQKIILIDEDGKFLGEKTLKEAVSLAGSKELDLIQVTNDEPPVCKIGDYSKFIYEEKRKLKKMNKPEVACKLKEIKFKTSIGPHDLKTKVTQIDSFLEKGSRIQLTIQLNRHQKERNDIAKEFLDQVLSGLTQKYALQGNPSVREYSYAVTLMSALKKGKIHG